MIHSPDTEKKSATTASWSLRCLLVLAACYTAYVAAAIVIPITAAMLLYFLFSPIIHILVRWHVLRPLAAILVTLTLASGLGLTVLTLAAPATDWIEQAPETIDNLRFKLRSRPNPLKTLRQASDAVEDAVTDITRGDQPDDEDATAVQIVEPDLLDGVIARAPVIVVSIVLTIILMLFLLMSGDQMLRNIVASGKTLQTRRRIVTIARQIERDISRYLGTVTLINAGLVLVVGLAMYSLGMPNPWLWGALAGALNFAPYLGPAVCIFAIFLASVESSSTVNAMLAPPLVYLLITSIEGQVVTPLLVGQRLKLSPIVVLLAVVFFGWIWGLAGALMAVPIVASARICLSNLPEFDRFGKLLGK